MAIPFKEKKHLSSSRNKKSNKSEKKFYCISWFYYSHKKKNLLIFNNSSPKQNLGEKITKNHSYYPRHIYPNHIFFFQRKKIWQIVFAHKKKFMGKGKITLMYSIITSMLLAEIPLESFCNALYYSFIKSCPSRDLAMCSYFVFIFHKAQHFINVCHFPIPDWVLILQIGSHMWIKTTSLRPDSFKMQAWI